MKTLAFVPPWYGASIPGGAEALTRRTVERLARSGGRVEILTTCVREFRSDWSENYHRPGSSQVNGVPVRRFPVRKRNVPAFDAVNAKLMHNQPITPEEEEIFVRENVCSPALADYVAQHQDEYTFIFIPYMFGTTYWGVPACEGKACMIPCVHDESYARMQVFRNMMKQVRLMILNSSAELALARSLYGVSQEAAVLMGVGVDTDFTPDAGAFRAKYGIQSPFVLYAGRRDHGKNVELLVDYMKRYRMARGPVVDLVLIGSQDPLKSAGEWIHDLGFVPVQDKYDACGAAALLCQPSVAESFSIVLMEAWVAGTPVLVHGGCAVTREHCIASNGGLYFENYAEFEACLDLLLARPDLGQALGANGSRYVHACYSWDIIVQRYRELFPEFIHPQVEQ